MMDNDATSVVEERSLRELLLQLSKDGSRLIEQEVALAKQEAREKLDQIQASVVKVSAGVLVLQTGLLALVAALILLLAQALPSWAAALSIACGFCVVGGLLFVSGKHDLKRVDVSPEKSKKGLKQDLEAVKEAAP
jgi:hypothetical protein